MCDFISIGLPSRLAKSLGQWRRRRFALAEHRNQTLRQALPSTYLPWLLTSGGCSCELCCELPKPKQPPTPGRAFFLRYDAAEIVRELAALHCGSSFLYVHFYSGDVSAEPLPIIGRTRMTPDSLSSHAAPILRDELIELAAPKRLKHAHQ